MSCEESVFERNRFGRLTQNQKESILYFGGPCGYIPCYGNKLNGVAMLDAGYRSVLVPLTLLTFGRFKLF